jgi:hypothetical protein
MDLTDYKDIAKTDCHIDPLCIKHYASETPIRTVKWLNFLDIEKRTLYGLSIEKRILYKKLYLYYAGLDNDGYEFVLGKTEIRQFIDADDSMVELDIKMYKYEEKVEYVEKIIDIFNRSTYHVKNIIDWEKFQNGG